MTINDQNINKKEMLHIGNVLKGTYRIERCLSSGGFGNTYVATNIEFEEVVAIKEFFIKGVTQRDANNTTVSVSNTQNKFLFEEQMQKFKKEARRLRKLNNPHIVKVYDLFEENGTAYYVMDYINGENLSEKLKRQQKPLSEAEVMKYLPQILDALACVHQEGLWHLDLKPANILVDRQGNITLIDFGASKQRSAIVGATTSTAVCYTNGFAPREQMEQNMEKFGPWTDIYALGATLYNLLTNKKPPLPSDIDDDRSSDKHLSLPMPDSISEKTKRLILNMLTTDRIDRPQSVENVWSMIGSDGKTVCEGNPTDVGTEKSDKDNNVKGQGKKYEKVSDNINSLRKKGDKIGKGKEATFDNNSDETIRKSGNSDDVRKSKKPSKNHNHANIGGTTKNDGNKEYNIGKIKTMVSKSRLVLSCSGSTTVCPDANHPHYVDLGLPSGTKWVCCNIGANKPEAFGGYYAWGEAKEKTIYDWDTYSHCDGSYDTFHNLGSNIAGTKYDLAHLKYEKLGRYIWRMPTLDQFKELLANCHYEWTTMNGVNGLMFTGVNGGTIFLPAAGYIGGYDLNLANCNGYYWSSMQDPSNSRNAFGLYFGSGYAFWSYGLRRDYGRSLRPVAIY